MFYGSPEATFWQIPKALHRHMLFIENWAEPDNFIFMSTTARMRLYKRLREQIFNPQLALRQKGYSLTRKHPTTTCSWVWFGSYTAFRKDRHRLNSLPRYNGQSVKRLIWHAFNHGMELDPRARLVPFPGRFQSDCNVYWHLPGFTGYRAKKDFYESIGFNAALAKANGKGAEVISKQSMHAIECAIARIVPDSDSLKSLGFELVFKTLKEIMGIENRQAVEKCFNVMLKKGYDEETYASQNADDSGHDHYTE